MLNTDEVYTIIVNSDGELSSEVYATRELAEKAFKTEVINLLESMSTSYTFFKIIEMGETAFSILTRDNESYDIIVKTNILHNG